MNIKYDSSGAYRCYDANKVKLADLLKAKNNSYSFFWESTFILNEKYNINEIPIDLPTRLAGASKMQIKDIFSAIYYLVTFYIKKSLN